MNVGLGQMPGLCRQQRGRRTTTRSSVLGGGTVRLSSIFLAAPISDGACQPPKRPTTGKSGGGVSPSSCDFATTPAFLADRGARRDSAADEDPNPNREAQLPEP